MSRAAKYCNEGKKNLSYDILTGCSMRCHVQIPVLTGKNKLESDGTPPGFTNKKAPALARAFVIK
jgi:hypothetical protein